MNIIKKLYKLYRVIQFTQRGDLIIKFNNSKIVFTKEGDLIINSGRHTIHNRDLFFDGCESKFIEEAIKNNNQSKKQLEKYVMSTNRASEFTCDNKQNTRIKDKQNVSNKNG